MLNIRVASKKEAQEKPENLGLQLVDSGTSRNLLHLEVLAQHPCSKIPALGARPIVRIANTTMPNVLVQRVVLDHLYVARRERRPETEFVVVGCVGAEVCVHHAEKEPGVKRTQDWSPRNSLYRLVHFVLALRKPAFLECLPIKLAPTGLGTSSFDDAWLDP